MRYCVVNHFCALVSVSVARLAFLRPNSKNFAFLKMVWHEKNGVWHVPHSLAFLAFFNGVGMKKHFWPFVKPLAQLLLSAWN